MDALLILGGLLLIVAGFVWLIVLAFGTSLLWGVGSLLPPVALLYIVRHWARARKAIGLSALGFIPLVVGLTLLASHDPERLEAIASLDWLEPDSPMHTSRLAIRLNGQLDGRPFSPQIGKFADGMLTLSDGDELFAQQAVNVRLGSVRPGGVQVDVLPQDLNPPHEIEISWMRPEQQLPEARLIQSGYTLHLNLQPVPPNKLAGDFHLVLPAHYKTSLSGHIEVFTDELRYRAGQVDLNHDSADTLKYLARDHLQRRFGTRDVVVGSVSPVNFSKPAKTLSVQAEVNGAPGQFELNIGKNYKGWAVDDDNYPPLPVEHGIKPKVAVTLTEPESVSSTSPGVDRRLRFSIDRLQRNPSHYEHLLMRAHTERGGVAEGRFVGIDREGNVAIRQMLKGPGEAIYNLAPNDIVLLELLEP
ncbi:MFS transporter [Stutzerimonas stutzeri]|uniref:MFS transporter n=1 Tax=Stutzerimonas stutzeri TaxID=316 RepID=UPI00210CDFBC|nr:MFS transporter [Stutzerimonas stutzeri]MCQ4256475.1 MFS transporter [Stutzerimonas stutzeri]